jgi:hypothetical protein
LPPLWYPSKGVKAEEAILWIFCTLLCIFRTNVAQNLW